MSDQPQHIGIDADTAEFVMGCVFEAACAEAEHPLPGELLRLRQENRAVWDALDTLLRAKDEKDTHGKTALYESLAADIARLAPSLRRRHDEYRSTRLLEDQFIMEAM